MKTTTLIVTCVLAACGAVKPLPADHFAAPTQATQAPAVVAVEPAGEPLPVLENTFGVDSRELVTSAQFPWSATGKLNTGCTATLIDQRLVLTAAHCILDANGTWLARSYQFHANMVGGHSRAAARAIHVWYGTRTPLRAGTDFRDDWAILLLDRDLGTAFRYIGTRDHLPRPGDAVTLVGYSADIDGGNTATAHVECRIQEGHLDGQITHDCDMTRGASGGPVLSSAWGEPVIVAVQSVERREGDSSSKLASYDGRHPNGAIPIAHFFPKLLWVVERH